LFRGGKSNIRNRRTSKGIVVIDGVCGRRKGEATEITPVMNNEEFYNDFRFGFFTRVCKNIK
jgi:hypothetical protein